MSGKSAIEYIRKIRRVPAKIGKWVTYAGHPYRIAWTSGDGLKLRSELLVHACDTYIDYDPPISTTSISNLREITRLRGLLYQMTTLEDWLKAGKTEDQYYATVGDFIEEDRRLNKKSG